MAQLTPFRLQPWFRTRIWGVRDLAPWYDYKVGDDPIGEVWLSGDDCTVDSGPLAGKTLSTVFAHHREDLLGVGSGNVARFPLLMKVLFPQEKLSVQVHPDDALAAQYHDEPHGKTECWYALEAKPDAKVALGFREGVTPEKVRAAIEDQSLEELLNWIPVEKGDMIFVDAGTVHAIGPGLVLLETQQNSDMTYRLYDYGRPRELHLEESFRAMRMQTEAGKIPPELQENSTLLIGSRYFAVDHTALAASTMPQAYGLAKSAAAQLVFVARGSGTLHADGCDPITLRAGEMALLPACAPLCSITVAEPMEIVRAIPR